MARDYVTCDEIEDALASTDLLALAISQLRKKPVFWKWVIIAAQNGLQGAIVCALHDGICVSVLNNNRREPFWRGMNIAAETIHLSEWPISGLFLKDFVGKTLGAKRKLLAFKYAIFTICIGVFVTISNTSLQRAGVFKRPGCLG
jgi:hypothetical protein